MSESDLMDSDVASELDYSSDSDSVYYRSDSDVSAECAHGPSFRYMLELMDDLWSQRSDKKKSLADVTLVVNGHEMKAHWCILVHVPYFEALYSSGMKEKREGRIEINGIVSEDIFEEVLRFIYTGEIELDEDKLDSVVKLADYLMAEQLKKTCEKFCLQLLSGYDCIKYLLLASKHDLKKLYKEAYEIFERDLVDIFEKGRDEVLLEIDLWMDILTKPELSYVPALLVFRGMLKWLRHDPEKRKADFEKIFCSLDLSRVNSKDLQEKIKTDDAVKSSKLCMNHVSQHEGRMSRGETSPDLEEKSVLVFTGGRPSGGHVTDCHYGFVFEDRRWVTLPRIPTNSDNHAIYPLKSNKTLGICGYPGVIGGASFSIFDVKSRKWGVKQECKNFNSYTVIHSAVNVSEKIYILQSSGQAIFNRKPDFSIICLDQPANKIVNCVNLNKSCKEMAIKAQMCAVNDEYFCTLVQGMSGKTYFFYFDVKEFTTSDVSQGAEYHSVLFSVGYKVFAVTIGGTGKVLNIKTKKWRKYKNTPSFPNQSEISDYQTYVHKGTIYVFGRGLDKVIYKLDISKGRQLWEKLPEAPVCFEGSKVCFVTLPSDILTCPTNCAHCRKPIFKMYTSNAWGKCSLKKANEEPSDDEDDYVDDEEDEPHWLFS